MRTQGVAVLFVLIGIGMIVTGCSAMSVEPTAVSTPLRSATPTPQPTRTPKPSSTPAPTRAAPERPLLMAHYMPWYQAPSVSGFWGWHWTMEHFDPAKTDGDGRREIASHTMPLTGPYDSADPHLLEYQVLLMKLSGIDGVIVDWYGIEDFWDYGTINEATHALFEVVKRAGLRFAICYEDQTLRFLTEYDRVATDDVLAHGQEVMRYLDETWFQDDAYLNYGGRPVLLTFGPQYFEAASDWEALTVGLSTDPALIFLDKHTESAALATYPWPPMWASTGGTLTPERLESYLAGFYTKAKDYPYLVASAFPGFHDIYEEAEVGSSYGYLDALDGEIFQMTLDFALAQNPDVIQLITWNDYGEGTVIEPTEEFGYRYLEMVQDVRRETDSEGFPFGAADLALPLQLWEARVGNRYNREVNAALDGVFEAVVVGDLQAASEILMEHAGVP